MPRRTGWWQREPACRRRRPSGNKWERWRRRSWCRTPSSPSRTSPTRAGRGVRDRAVPSACAWRQRSGATGAITAGGARIQATLTSHRGCAGGSKGGRLCQPVPPGTRADQITACVAGRRDSIPVLNAARHVPPSGGTAMYAARQRPRTTVPGRLLRDGSTPSGSTNAAVRPGDCGTIVIVTSVPAATCLSVNPPTVAGAGPGGGAVARKTYAGPNRPDGTVVFGTSVARYQPPGALASRSRPGSCEPTSYVDVAAPGSVITRKYRRWG